MRHYLLSAWTIFDPLYYRCTRLVYLQDTEAGKNIFRVRLTRYKGREILLADGTRIAKNDLLVKIHLHNVCLLTELYPVKSDVRKAKLIYHKVHDSLPGIEGYVSSHKRSNEIKGIIGITNLSTGSTRLGFEVFSITHPIYKWAKWFTFLPITLLAANQLSFKKLISKSQPHYLLMSKDNLSRLYKR
jgi:hypothetical protein